jgi:Ser/Thr protein kinase RdoA (MazF antagonist)
MAVKTTFSTRELEAILSGYDLGAYISSRGFGRGADQTNMRVTTSQGAYSFRYYEKRLEDYVRFELDLLRFLRGKSYPCPAPIQQRDGSYFGMHKNKPYAIFTLMEGETEERSGNYRLVAPALAWLHDLTRGHEPVYSEARAQYGPAYAWSRAQAHTSGAVPPEETQERLVWMKEELDTLRLPEDLPKGVCHCDANPSNFLFKNGKLSAVLDFDQAAYIWLLYDVAQMIYWWTWPDNGAIQLEESRDLVAQYQTVRKLPDDERRHLFDMLKLVHLVGIGWSFSDDSFANDQRKVVELNTLGSDRFYDAIFG